MAQGDTTNQQKIASMYEYLLGKYANITILTDSSGNLIDTFGAASTDGAAFTADTSTGTPMQGVYEATPSTVSDGKMGVVAIDTNRNIKTTMQTALNKDDDSVTARPEGTTFVNLTASGVVSAAPCILVGMYVNSTSSGTAKLYDNASAASGTVINNTITPAIGWHNLGNALTTNGVYATIGATLDVTFYVIVI